MKKLYIFSLVLMLILSACGGSQLEITDPGQTIDVNSGEEFQIVIESNPTTGYHWEIVGDLDASLVEFVGSEYVSTSDPEMTGGGGLDIWTFKAVGPGSATIVLGSYPPSNDPVEPENTVTFSVAVK